MHRAREGVASGLLIVSVWSLYAVFTASQNWVSSSYAARIPWRRALAYSAIDAYPWAALTPLALWIAGRLVVRRGNWWWSLPALFAAGIGFAALHLFVFIRL